MKLNNFCFLSVRFRHHTFSVCNLNSTQMQMCVIFHCVYSKCCLCVCFYGLLLLLRILTINKTYTHTYTYTNIDTQLAQVLSEKKEKLNPTTHEILYIVYFLMSSFLPCHDILPGCSVVVSHTYTHTLNTHATPHSEPCYCVQHLLFIKSSCT